MKLNFCPECAAPLHKESATRYICAHGHRYYNNARATTAIILLKDGQALYAKRAVEPHKDKYDFPGGFIDFAEDAYDASARELQEETGLVARDLSLVHSTAQQYEENVSVCDFIFACTAWSGAPKPADDVAALEWKPIEFIDSSEFAWNYKGLVAKLQDFIKN